MNLSLILMGIEKGIEYEPKLAAIIKALFTTANPTAEQWDQAQLAALELDYDKLVPESAKLQSAANVVTLV